MYSIVSLFYVHCGRLVMLSMLLSIIWDHLIEVLIIKCTSMKIIVQL